MVVAKNPFMSFDAHGTFGKLLTVRRQHGKHIIQKYPRYVYSCSALQLVERDRMRRLQVIARWYKDQDGMERLTEIRPEIIFDPSGPTYIFDMGCGGGSSGALNFGTVGLTWETDFTSGREGKEAFWYGVLK